MRQSSINNATAAASQHVCRGYAHVHDVFSLQKAETVSVCVEMTKRSTKAESGQRRSNRQIVCLYETAGLMSLSNNAENLMLK